jgi:curli biogenesis system outer membrane secretion channel CsgG
MPYNPGKWKRTFQEVFMKKYIRILVLGLALIATAGLFSGGAAGAEEKPRIGVLRFTNQTSAGWWHGGVGSELQDMLINELASNKSLRVLERKELDAVLGEQDLGASGRIAPNTRAKLGQVTGAKYLVAATVSAFEEGASGQGGGISIGGISVGGKQERAYIAVDLKVIDVDTGEIAESRTVEATSKSGGLSLGLHTFGIGGELNKQAKTPTGKAIRACIVEIAEYLDCSMVRGSKDPCMAEYKAKEQKRREKTKGSVDLE